MSRCRRRERRKPGRGKTYIRRSMPGQGVGPEGALDWALDKAHKLGIPLNADHAGLKEFISRESGIRDDLYYEGGISGFSSDRPVLQRFLEDVLGDETVSHVLVHMPDRLLRPEDPIEGMLLERKLLDAGITLVFQDQVIEPDESGKRDAGRDLTSYLKYMQSGEELEKLADRMVRAKTTLAKGGYWGGGRPPYGFGRMLVDAAGKIVLELKDGQTDRQQGCHVRIMPTDTLKIGVWLEILELYCQGWGTKRIANHLNERGIPSPGAGQTRRYADGVPRPVPGVWTPSSIGALIDNHAIIGILKYGVRSEGKIRRIGVDGPRYLKDSDVRDDGREKVVRNPEELVISAPTGFGAQVPIELFEKAQAQRQERGRSQKGISRAKDPPKYVFSGRVFNPTLDDEGRFQWTPMYGRTRSRSKEYVCGVYQRCKGRSKTVARDGRRDFVALLASGFCRFGWDSVVRVGSPVPIESKGVRQECIPTWHSGRM